MRFATSQNWSFYVRSNMGSGLETAGVSRWSSCRIVFSVTEGLSASAYGIRATDFHLSFCIAPLDVLKIRLQLQIQTLPDPSSSHSVVSEIQRGTISTFKSIVRDEGVTVHLNHPVASTPTPAGLANHFFHQGSLER